MKTLNFVFYLAITMSIIICYGCGKDDEVPTVVTGGVTNITSTTVNCSGTITSIGDSGITESGIAYSDDGADCFQGDGALFPGEYTVTIGNGPFPTQWCDLEPDTQYSYWAYATNSAGTGLGEKKYFKTSP